MNANERLLKQLMGIQEQSISDFQRFTGLLLFLGVVTFIITFAISAQLNADQFKAVSGIGGGFISSLSAYPAKEVITRRERLKILQAVGHLITDQHDPTKVTSDEDKAQIAEQVKLILSKLAGG